MVPGDGAARRRAIARDLEHLSTDFVGDKNHVFARAGRGRVLRDPHPDVSQGASQVSAHPEVRAALLELQRRPGRGRRCRGRRARHRDRRVPVAEAKFFLTANDEERARRRVAELTAAGQARRRRADQGRDRRARRRATRRAPRRRCARPTTPSRSTPARWTPTRSSHAWPTCRRRNAVAWLTQAEALAQVPGGLARDFDGVAAAGAGGVSADLLGLEAHDVLQVDQRAPVHAREAVTGQALSSSCSDSALRYFASACIP